MEFEKITGRIGARVVGIDLTKPLDAFGVTAIRAGLDAHHVLFFAGQQKLDGEQHLRFARNFGEIAVSPFSTNASSTPEVMVLDFIKPSESGTDSWHTDGSFHDAPPAGSILQAHLLPKTG